ncbi:MAG: hypothetical protein R2809_07260 [Flavobacteriales bacterium]
MEPGVGYDYWWSPTATNGTWADNSGGTLPSGTYESFGDLSDLVGCPLNGAWAIEVCDMWDQIMDLFSTGESLCRLPLPRSDLIHTINWSRL